LDQEREPDPLDDDQDELPLSRPETAKRITVRTGIGVLAFGLLITLYGASQLAGGAPVYGSYAGVFHQIGLVIMFLGTITLLIGYRIPWFANFMGARTRPAGPTSGESVTITSAEASHIATAQLDTSMPDNSGRKWDQEPWTANLVLFGILVALFICSTLLVFLLPHQLAALPAIIITALAFLFSLIGLVYGSSLQRTFCIGTMITLGLLFAQWWLLIVTSFSIGGAWTRRSYSDPLFGYLRDVMQLLGAAAGASRVSTIIMWAAALCFGVAAIGFRFVLETINQANRQRRS